MDEEMGAQKSAWQRQAVNPGNLAPASALDDPFSMTAGNCSGRSSASGLERSWGSSWQREQFQFFLRYDFQLNTGA